MRLDEVPDWERGSISTVRLSIAQDWSNAAVEPPTVLLMTVAAERLFGSQRSENPNPDRLPRSGLDGELARTAPQP